MNAYRATENYVYKTDECIGRGATGDVYKGVHKVRISNSTFSFVLSEDYIFSKIIIYSRLILELVLEQDYLAPVRKDSSTTLINFIYI